MKAILSWTAVVIFALTSAAGAGPEAINYTGHYELADAHSDQSFSLDITQTGSKADVSFSAAMADGSGSRSGWRRQGRRRRGRRPDLQV